jgi:hypothetical protein
LRFRGDRFDPWAPEAAWPRATTRVRYRSGVFLLATGTSMMALTVHTDRAHMDQDSPYRAVHQKTALVY